MKDLFRSIDAFALGTTGDYCRDPRVCVDSLGRWWVAWISWEEKGERVRACYREPGRPWSSPMPCGPHRPFVTGLDIAAWGDGAIVAWVDGKDPDNDGLKVVEIGPGGSGEPRLVSPARRSPSLPAVCSDEDRILLAWRSSSPGGRRIEAMLTFDPAETSLARTVSMGSGNNTTPAVSMRGDEAWIAWQNWDRSGARIVARRLKEGASESTPPIVAAGGGGSIPAMPALCVTEDRTWLAWQSDMDPEQGPCLVRWIDLVALDEEDRVVRPASPMPEIERRTAAEDQGFESPCLVTNPRGSITLIGRGSQSLRRQDLGEDGWSSRGRIDQEGWKCRSPRYGACSCEEGILVAGREKDGVTVRLLPHNPSGPPMVTSPAAPATRMSSTPPSDRPQVLSMGGHRIFFGDIHQHTSASDGTGTATETFLRARVRYRDDLCAVADHESFLGKRTPPGEWAGLWETVEEHNAPGEFVTLLAFEWTGKMHPGPGHKVGYLPPRGGPCLSRDDEATKTSAGLVDACRRIGALLFPHHVGWTGADMDNHDPRVQTCWEIVSAHGAYERIGGSPIGTRGDDKEGQFVADALDQGLRFGFVGGSDGHGLAWHHGVCRMEDSHRSGLTAVACDELTRDSVFEALSNRRCYATSGAKIGLWFEVAGFPMGEEIPVSESVSFRVMVEATAEISQLCLVTNGGKEITLEAGGSRIEASGTLPKPMDGSSAYYFVRLVQEDGHVAWSSPIWLDAPGSPGSGLPAA